MEVKDNVFQRQYEYEHEKGLFRIEYTEQERKVFLTKIVVPDSVDEAEINSFIQAVLDFLHEKNARVVPTSSKIVKFFKKNHKYKSMLPPGVVV